MNDVKFTDEISRTLLSNLCGVVYRCELSVPWKVSFISDGVENITGYSAQKFMEMEINWADIVFAEDLETLDSTVLKAIDSHQPYETKYRICSKEGKIIWVQEKGQAVYNESGKPLCLDGFIHDIDKIVKVEQALEEANRDLDYRVQQRTKELLNTNRKLTEAQRIAHLGSWEMDLCNNSVEGSDEFIQIFEIDSNSTATSRETLHDIVHPEDREMVNKAYSDSVISKTPIEIEYRLLMPDGRVKNVQERSETYYDESCNPIRTVGTVQDISDHKIAEHQLCIKDAALDSSLNAVAIANLQGKLIYINSSFLELWGYNSETLVLGCLVTEFWKNPGDAVHVVSALKSHGSWSGELIALNQNKKEFVVELSAVMINDSLGNPSHMLATFIDITDRIHTMEALKESELRLRTMYDTASEGILFCDAITLQLTFANNTVTQMFGYPNSDITNLNIMDLHPRESHERIKREITRIQHNGNDLVENLPALRKDGSVFIADINVSFTNINGKHAFIGFIRDVTNRVHAENELQRQAQIIDQIHDSVIATDLDGNITSWNLGAERIFGFTKDEIIGKNIISVYPDEQKEFLTKDIIPTLKKNGTHDVEVIMQCKSGEKIIAHLSLSMLYDNDGYAYGMIGYSMDITDKKHAEDNIRISHELIDAVFDNTHVLIAVLDQDLNFQRVNRAYAIADNQLPDYFIGKNHFELYPNKENEKIFRAAVLTGQVAEFRAKPFEYESNPARGVTHWDWTLTPIKDDQGKVSTLVLALLNVSERVRSMEHLRHSEKKLRALNESLEIRVNERTKDLENQRNFIETVIDTVGALVVVMDIHGNIIKFNHACEESTGYDAGETLYRKVWDFLIVESERKSVKNVFCSLQSGQFPSQNENYWLTKNGNKRLIYWSNTCLTDSNGKVEFIIGTGMDITSQRDVELQLRESEFRLRQITEHSNNTFYLANIKSNNILFITNSVKKILGGNIKSGELSNSYPVWLGMVHPDDKQKVVENYSSWYLYGRGRFDIEYRIYDSYNKMRWIREVGYKITDEPGLSNCYGGILEDISVRKLTEQALKSSEEQLRLLSENIRDVFWLTSPQHDLFYYISPAYEKVWGRSRESLYKNPELYIEAVHHKDRDMVVAADDFMAKDHLLDYYEQEFRIVRPDGEIRTIFNRYQPIYDAQGAVFRLAGISEDITDRKQAQEQRIELERKQKDTLIREIHHRIKNNLQGVIGLLREHSQRDVLLRDSMNIAISQVSTMALVHGLQSKDHSERVSLCDLCNVIANSISSITGSEIQSDMNFDLYESLLIVPHEAVPIALVLNELIFNAVKHSDTNINKKVDLTIFNMDGRLVVRIANYPKKQLLKNINIAKDYINTTGLGLVQALLPSHAHADLRKDGDKIITEFVMQKSLIEKKVVHTEN